MERTVKADGSAFFAEGVRPKASRYVSQFIESGLRRSSRMRFQAKSRAVGHPPAAFSGLWDVYLKGWSQDSWIFLAPTIESAAPTLMHQPSLFGEDFSEKDTAFEFLQDAINAVRQGSEDSVRFDPDLLSDFEMAGASKSGVSTINLLGVSRPSLFPADQELAAQAKSLLIRTPPAQLVRIVGTLDMYRSSDGNFEFVIEGGKRLRGIWVGQHSESLWSYGDKTVTMDAVMVYRPNGKPLRLEGRSVRQPVEGDLAFAGPNFEFQSSDLVVPKGVLTVREWFGSWPGNESDEEIEELLDQIR